MANFDVSYFVRLRDQFSKPGEKVANAAMKMNAQFEKLAKTLPKLNPQLGKLSDKVKRVTPALNHLNTAAAQVNPAFDVLADMIKDVNVKLDGMAAHTAEVNKKLDALGDKVKKVKPNIQSLAKTLKKAGQAMTSFGNNMTMKATAPLLLLGGVALKQSAKLETLGLSFEVMLKSADKGKKMMTDLLQFTAKTPFQLEGVMQSAKTLLSFGVAQKEMIPTLKMLGDVASGANIPIKDMARIFGKTKAKGKAMAEELLQMSDRGIPILAKLAKGFGKTKNEIFKMAEKSQISFEHVSKALKHMTIKSAKHTGIFFNMMERQSATLAGRWSNLEDAFVTTAASIGDVLSESTGLNAILKDMAEGLGPLAEKVKVFAEAHPGIAKLIVGFGIFVAVLGPVVLFIGQFALAISAMITIAPFVAAAFGAIATAVGFLTGGMASLAIAVLAVTWPILALGAAFFAAFKGTQLLLGFLGDKFPSAATAFHDTVFSVIQGILAFIDDPMAHIKKFVEYLRGIDLNPFKDKFDILPSLDDIKNSIEITAAGITGGLLGGAGADSVPVQSNQSQTDINVNLNAPEGVVDSVKTRTSGGSAPRVGTNMRNS